MEPAPAIGARPSPGDIVRYNAWADRNGQPRLGAGLPVAPAPKRRGRPGLPVPAPPAHGQVDHGVGGGWRRGTYWVNRTEYALNAAGVVRKLRSWNSRTGQYTWFPAGREYYAQNRQKFLINVPCLGYIPANALRQVDPEADFPADPGLDADAEGSPADAPLMRASIWGEGHQNRVIPLTPEAAENYVRPRAMLRLENLGVVRDEDHTQADIEAALRREVPALLSQLPRVNTVDGMKHKVAVESSIVWVWDETQPLTFDEQIFRHMHEGGVPLIETLLDRPLLGLPYIDEHMYGRQGLSKIACLDLTDRGGCVVAQIVELVQKTERKKVATPGGQRGGKDTRARVSEVVPRFTPAQVAEQFDRIFARMFPGEAVDEEAFEAGEVEAQRPAPFQFAGWREVGITTRMVAEFCDIQKIGLRVLYKNTVIFKNDVQAKHTGPVIVYQICGDHAYFYEDQYVKHGATQLRQGPSRIQVKAEALVRLRTRADEDDVVPFADMEEFRLEPFLEQVEAKISKTYYCYQREVKDVKRQLEEAGVPIWTGLGARPELIRSLNVCQKTRKAENLGKRKASEKKVQIRVRVVPDDAECLQEASLQFGEVTGLKLVYTGESRSGFTHRMLNALFVSRRLKIPAEVRAAVQERQKSLCALCGDKLGPKFELDHISPLCQGGSSDVDNLRALCQPCHAEETDRLLLAGMDLGDQAKFHTIESHLSPKLHRELHQAPKPKEVSYGVFKDTKQVRSKVAPRTQKAEKQEARRRKIGAFQMKFVKRMGLKSKNVLDALQGHERPEAVPTEPVPLLPSAVSDLTCLDAVGCRRNALIKRTRGLPVFSPLDEWEPFSQQALPDVDFVYIQVDGRVHKGLFPFTGNRWYAAEVCEYLLERQIVGVGNCKAALRATRHVPSDALERMMQTIEDVYERVEFPSAKKRKAYVKSAILAMIGLWNSTSQHSWKQFQGMYEIDAGPGVKLRRRMDDGSFLFTSSTELVGLYSMAPWGRIALDTEQLRIAQALASVDRYPQHLTNVGVHVDGIFLLVHSFEGSEILARICREHCFPDGSPVFHIKTEPACKVPTWKAGDVERSQSLEFTRHEWRTLQEWEVPDAGWLADRVLECGGLLLKGAAGTGKTRGDVGVRKLMKALVERQPGKHLAMALRHCTAMLMCGKTIAHYLHKYRRKGGAPSPGTVVIIDEWSEVQLHTWIELAQWKLVGVIFIVVGDADGQRKPIFDRWQDAMDAKDIRKSQLIHELCGGLCVNLTVYRRGTDQELFDRYTGLYGVADDDSRVPEVVAQMRDLYPYGMGDVCGHYFVISHRKRKLLNHAFNWLLADRQREVELIPCFGDMPGASMQPQDMIVWKGQELLCYSRRYAKNSPVTGAVYVVESWDGARLTVSLHEDYVGEQLVEAPVEEEGEPEHEPEDESEDEPEDEEALEELDTTTDDRACTKRILQVRRADGSVVQKTAYQLTYKRASEILRLQHALVYASIQGRTMKTSVALMDLDSDKLTMRDVITAMSRPTTGSDLRFMSERQQEELLAQIQNRYASFDLRKRVAECRAREPSERPTPSRIGR